MVKSPVLVHWNGLENLPVMKMPYATKMMVPLHVHVEIPISVMALLLDQAVLKVTDKIPFKLIMIVLF